MRTRLFAIAVLAATASGGAQAALSLTGFGGFVRGSDSGFPELEYFGCDDSLCTSIAWGTPRGTMGPFGGKSSASINVLADNTDPGSTPVQARATSLPGSDDTTISYDDQSLEQWQVLGSLTHWNRVISQFDFLGEVDVEYSVEISDGTETVTLDEIFGVSFFETLNSAPCDPPNPLGSTCDDWFEYEGALEESFVLSGTEYSVRIRGFCDQGTDPDTCVPGRLYTAENEATVGLVYEIKAGGTAAAAPAPGVLVLIGTGLLGLAFARRRAAQG